MSGQTPNVEGLQETLTHIEAHPEDWYQGDYRCRSGMCFAGWRAELSGGQWAFPVTSPFSDLLVAEPADADGQVAELAGKRVVSAFDRASRLLGLSESQAARLFDPNNDLDDLRYLVGELCSGGES